MLSIIVPTLNESKSDFLSKILHQYKDLARAEIICVDGGSTDNTKKLINAANVTLIETELQTRAARLNAGITAAKHDLVLLHHPRSVIELPGLEALIDKQSSLEWGAFTHKFDNPHPLLTFTSWYSNNIRGDWRKIYYLDHCIFAKKAILQKIGLVPDIPIFEDTELCILLKRQAKPTRLEHISETSAIRFTKHNIYKQSLLNQKMKWQYYFKQSKDKMNKNYEKGLELNTQYSQVSPKKKAD